MFLATLKPNADLKFILLVSTLVFGVCLMLFSQTTYFPLAMVFAAFAGFGTMAQTTISITIIQVKGDAAMRGRVMSFVAMSLFGMLPLGSLLIGTLSQQIGAPAAIFCQGLIAVLIALGFTKFLGGNRFSKKMKVGLEEAEDTMIEQI